MFSKITSLVLAIALVLTGFWGYREHRQKQALMLKAENQYQRAFHDLSDRMNGLQDSLGKTLAVNSRKQLSTSMSESWRLASEAHSDVGQLPLSLMPFNNTMNFLNDLGNFSYRTAIRHPDDAKTLSEDDYKTLQTLYHRSQDMENQLSNLQAQVLSKNLRWMDAELALSQSEKKTDNQIVDGFKALEKQASGMKALTFSGPTQNDLQTRHKADVKKLTGTDVNEQQAAQIVQNWLGLKSAAGIQVMRNGEGTAYPSYSVNVPIANDGTLFFTVTVKGGHITSMMNNRDVPQENLDLDQGSQKALQYLKAHKIDATELIKTDSYDHVGVYSFVPMQSGVRLYPDKVVVKVALDNGDIVGINSQDYEFNHVARTLPKPKLTEQQARTYVNPHVKIHETHQALVLNDLNQEVLAFEFTSTMENDTFQIYINAQSGEEVGVEKLG